MKRIVGDAERRRHTRYHVHDGAYAFINNIPFVIRNISAGGLRIQSVVFDDVPPDQMTLDIFCKHDNFYLQDIPVRLVVLQKNQSRNTLISAHINYFGLQFGELTEQQQTRLDYFISRSTTSQT